MIFLLAAGFGGFLGTIMLATMAIPPSALRLLRLLPGDRRIWWTLGALVAAATVRPIILAQHDFAEPSENISRGVFQATVFGGYVAIGFGWLVGTICLTWIGRASADMPVSKTAWPLAIVVAFVGVFLAIDDTEAKRQTLLDQRASAIATIKSADPVATAKVLRSDFDLRQRYSELDGHKPFGFAIATGDPDFIRVFLELPDDKKPDMNQWIGEFLKTGDQQLMDLMIDELGGPTREVLGRVMNIAVIYSATDAFDYAMEQGGDPDHLYSYSTLMLAAKANQHEFAHKLVTAGADLNQTHHSAWGGTGKTAVAFAAEEGHFDMVRYLVESGADTTIADTEGNLPLDLATRSGHQDVVTFLKTRGA